MPQQQGVRFDTNIDSILARLSSSKPTPLPYPNLDRIGSRINIPTNPIAPLRPPEYDPVPLDQTPLTETDPYLAMIRDAVGGFLGLNEGLLGESTAGAIGDATGLIGPGSGMKLGAVAFPTLARVFHGTAKKFGKLGAMPDQRVRDTLGDMFHFAEDPVYAGRYAGGESGNIRVSSLDTPTTLDLTQKLPEEDISTLLDAGVSPGDVDDIIKRIDKSAWDVGDALHNVRMDKGLLNSGEVLPGSPFTGVRYYDYDKGRGPVWAVPRADQEKLDFIYEYPWGEYIRDIDSLNTQDKVEQFKDLIQKMQNYIIQPEMIQSSPSWMDIFKDESGALNLDRIKELWRSLNQGPMPIQDPKNPVGRAEDLIKLLGGEVKPIGRGLIQDKSRPASFFRSGLDEFGNRSDESQLEMLIQSMIDAFGGGPTLPGPRR